MSWKDCLLSLKNIDEPTYGVLKVLAELNQGVEVDLA